MKKAKRFLAMLLTSVLCIGELATTGMTVSAAGDEAQVSEETEAAEEDEGSADAEAAFNEGSADAEAVFSVEAAGSEDAEAAFGAEADENGQAQETVSVPAQDIDADELTDDGFNKTRDNTRFGISGWADPVVSKSDGDKWNGSFLYFGNNTHNSYSGIKWRVLDTETTDYNEPGVTRPTILLNSDENLFKTSFGNTKPWEESSVKDEINGSLFYRDCFSYAEKQLIVPSYKTKKSSTDGKSVSRSGFAKLEGEQIFLLDEAEAKSRIYGFADHDEDTATRYKDSAYNDGNTWWLRSTESRDNSFAETVDENGYIRKKRKSGEEWISPAMNIDPSDVAFSTVVEGKWGEPGAAYKLTLYDSDYWLYFELMWHATAKANVIRIPYKKEGSTTDVSVMIYDGEYVQGGDNDSGKILYLNTLESVREGSILDSHEVGGEFEFPSDLDIKKWDIDYNVYLIPGRINSASRTDYAGKFIKLSKGRLLIECTVDFDMNGGGTPVAYSQKYSDGYCIKEPLAPSRDGYVFGGWYTTKDCKQGTEFDFKSPAHGDFTLYAKWKKLCNVSFDANGGTGAMDPLSAAQEDYITLPACEFTAPPDDMGRNEMIFGGWEVKGSKRSPGSKLYISDDTVIKAVWIHEDYRDVHFYDKYGENIHLRILNGNKVDMPDAPNHEGYTFLGWYTSNYADNTADDRNLYDFTKPVTGDLALYAAYTDDTLYHIKITQSPGGTVTVDKEYVKILETVTLSVTTDPYYDLWFVSRVPVVDHSSYKFINIYPEDLTDGKYTFKFPDLSKAPSYDKQISISVFYNVQEGHEHTWEYHEGIRGNCHDGGKYGYVECTECGHRYAWDSWHDKVLYDVTDYEDPYCDMMEYHGYIEGKEYVQAKAATCSASGNIAYTYCKDCKKCLIGPNYIIEGTEEDVIIPIDEDAHDWDPSSISYIWSEDKMTVTASCTCLNDPSHVVTEKVNVDLSYTKEPTCDEGGIARLKTQPFNFYLFTEQKMDVEVGKLGHDWDEPVYAWSDDLSKVSASAVCRNDPTHNEEETAAVSVTEKERFTEYTAVFTNELFEDQTKLFVNVSFDANGQTATGMPETIKTDLGSIVARPASDPVSAGLKFIGWYADEAGSQAFDFAKPINKNTVIYARWVNENAKMCTVSFNMMGHGAGVASAEVESGKPVAKPADPVEAGWVFGGWYKEETLQNKYDFSSAVTEDLTLFAKWTEKKDSEPRMISALDPLPQITELTEDIYLVKGQKFVIGEGWEIEKGDSESKKHVSINKKGQITAKKAGNAVIQNNGRKLNVHVFKPTIKKSLKLEAGQSTENVIELKDYDADNMPVLWYSNNPDAALVEDGAVTAVAKGKAKITAYINGNAYSCTVSVTEKNGTVQNRTMHVAAGASKSITVKVKGVKKLDWKSASENVASVKKNKVKATGAGNTVLSASANGTEYTIDLYAEDLTLSGEEGKFAAEKGANKYSLNLNAGDETQIHFSDSLVQPVIFKSSKPLTAFIDENGKVVARAPGKAKFTAKVDGKTITINVVVR